jgi:hypothetical protein
MPRPSRPRRPQPPLALATVLPLVLLPLVAAVVAAPAPTPTSPAHGIGRSLLIADDDPGASDAYPMDDPKYEFSRDIPLSDPRLRKPGGKGCNVAADGLRLTHWGPGSVLVTWSSCDPVIFPPAPGRPAELGPAPESKPPPPPPPIGQGEWAVEVWQRSRRLRRVPVDPTYTLQYESHFPDRRNGNTYAGGYRSGRLSHVLLDGLTPGGVYRYRVVRRRVLRQQTTVWQEMSPLRAFEAPWRADQLASASGGGFYRIGVVGDPGQTPDTLNTITALSKTDPRAILILGDISYADDFTADGKPMAGGGVARPDWYTQNGNGEQTFEYKSDTSSRLWAPVAARIPISTTPGNHDYLSHNYTDRANKVGTYFLAYNARFPNPNGGGHWSLAFGPNQLPPLNAAPPMPPREQLDPVPTSTAGDLLPGVPTNLFYSTELPGATLIFVTPYIPADWGPGTAQYEFVEQTLQRVDRARTPWVIVGTHGNLYSTYRGHFKGLECFRLAYEPLFLKYGVDLVLNGHTHAYERFHPSADYKLDPCGIVHITVGDGGNIEGFDGMEGIEENTDDQTQGGWNWKCFEYEKRPAPNPGGGGRKLNCPTLQPEYTPGSPTAYCWTVRPPISAFRKPSFGFGTLDLFNATTARWTWRANSKQGARNAPARSPIRDEVWLTRGPEADAKAGCVRGVGR